MNLREQTLMWDVRTKLDAFREIIVKEGNARILDECDKIRQYVQSISDELSGKKQPALANQILGALIIFSFIGPWIYGIYRFIGLFI